MPRKRFSRQHRKQLLTTSERRWLLYGDKPSSDHDVLRLVYHREDGPLWQLHKDALLAEFIAKHPGRRPYGWWEFDGVGREERKKLSGSGRLNACVYGKGLRGYFECDPSDPPMVESEPVS